MTGSERVAMLIFHPQSQRGNPLHLHFDWCPLNYPSPIIERTKLCNGILRHRAGEGEEVLLMDLQVKIGGLLLPGDLSFFGPGSNPQL